MRKPKKRRKQTRVAFCHAGGNIARFGYFAAPVQKVVRRWRRMMTEDEIQYYFWQIAGPLFCEVENLTVQVSPFEPNAWALVFELGAAINKVLTDKRKIDYWLLTHPIDVTVNGEADTWEQISRDILKRSKLLFTAEQLRQAAKRLKLSPTVEMAIAVRRRDKFPEKDIWRTRCVTKMG